MRIPALAGLLAALVAVPAGAQPCAPRWSDDLWAHAPPGDVRALAVIDLGQGPALTIGTIGAEQEGWIARYDASRLRVIGHAEGQMPGGNASGVYALTCFDDGAGAAVFAGGVFTTVDGVPASGIARWSGGAWQPLGAGTDQGVRALAAYDGGAGPALYAGGFFHAAGGVPASRVARWNGAEWAALGEGLAGGGTSSGATTWPVAYALTVHDFGAGPVLCVGGNFDLAGGIAATNVAAWNGSTWSALGRGPTYSPTEHGSVLALTVFDAGSGPELYAGGRVRLGEVPCVRAARWDGAAWQPVGSCLTGQWISALAPGDVGAGAALYAGLVTGTSSGLVHRLDGAQWTSLGTAAPTSQCRALAAYDDHAVQLYCGGDFGTLAGAFTPRLGRWNGSAWTPIPAPGCLDEPDRLKVLDTGPGPELYLIGASRVAGIIVPGLARFDGAAWHPVGPPGQLISPSELEVFDDGAGPLLYASGSLDFGSVHYRVACLRKNGWEGVGPSTHTLLESSPRVLRTFDDGLGPRLFAGGALVGGVLAWDGVAWTRPGGGLPGFSGGSGVRDLEPFDAGSGLRLYAAWVNGFARWDGVAWETLPEWIPSITDLQTFDDGSGPALFAARASTVDSVLRFDGAAWTVVASVSDHSVIALSPFDDGSGPALYASGHFGSIGGVEARGIARWHAGSWSPLGSGLLGPGETLTAFGLPQPALWVAGSFEIAGGQSAGHLARWIGCPTCYPDCDGSGTLDVGDYICFQTKFALGDPYADCDANGIRNVADFICFQTAFALGCA